MMDEANGSIPHVDHQGEFRILNFLKKFLSHLVIPGNDALDARANQSTSNRYAFGGALSELPPPPKKRARSAGAASLFPSVAAVKAVSSPQPSIMTNHNCSSARCAQHPVSITLLLGHKLDQFLKYYGLPERTNRATRDIRAEQWSNGRPRNNLQVELAAGTHFLHLQKLSFVP